MLNSFATDSLQKGKKQATNSKMRQGWHRLKGIFKPKSNAIEPQDADNKKPSIADILAEVMRKQKAMYEDNEENTSNKSDHSKTGDGKGMFECSGTLGRIGEKGITKYLYPVRPYFFRLFSIYFLSIYFL